MSGVLEDLIAIAEKQRRSLGRTVDVVRRLRKRVMELEEKVERMEETISELEQIRYHGEVS